MTVEAISAKAEQFFFWFFIENLTLSLPVLHCKYRPTFEQQYLKMVRVNNAVTRTSFKSIR